MDTKWTEIGEEGGRLVVRFYASSYSTDGLAIVERELTHTIDITAHIERAVENVLNKPRGYDRNGVYGWLRP